MSAFSKPVIDWATVPEHQRGQWFVVGGKYIKLEDLSVEDLPKPEASQPEH